MIAVLDPSAAVELILNRPQKDKIEHHVLTADLVISPDLFIAEISNVFWKYHHFESLQSEFCEEFIEKSIQLIDQFEPGSTLYREAFQLACETKRPVYDAFYMVLARRNNGTLVSVDNKLKKIAKSQRIKIIK